MVMGFSLRLADNTFALHIEPPLELEATGDLQCDVRVNTKKVAAVLERYIGRHPEQWVMFRPIWRMADSKQPMADNWGDQINEDRPRLAL